jgi:hypothetical protein
MFNSSPQNHDTILVYISQNHMHDWSNHRLMLWLPANPPCPFSGHAHLADHFNGWRAPSHPSRTVGADLGVALLGAKSYRPSDHLPLQNMWVMHRCLWRDVYGEGNQSARPGRCLSGRTITRVWRRRSRHALPLRIGGGVVEAIGGRTDWHMKVRLANMLTISDESLYSAKNFIS